MQSARRLSRSWNRQLARQPSLNQRACRYQRRLRLRRPGSRDRPLGLLWSRMHVFVMSNVSRKGGKQVPAPAPYVAPAVGLACSPPSRRPPTSGSASSSSFAGWSSYSDCVKYISKYAHKGRDPIFYDHRPVDEIEYFGRRRHAYARLRGTHRRCQSEE